MDLKKMGINTRNWVDLAEDRDYLRALVNVALNLRVSQVMEFVVRVIDVFMLKTCKVYHNNNIHN